MSLFTKRASTDWIVIHCSATRPSQNIDAAEIARWHRMRGFVGIGYHYVIKRDGTVERGRPEDTVGAHVSGHNHNSIGICLVGGVSEKDVNKPESNFTKAQLAALKALIVDVRTRYPNTKVQGHRDFPNVNKACPSFNAKWWAKRNGF